MQLLNKIALEEIKNLNSSRDAPFPSITVCPLTNVTDNIDKVHGNTIKELLIQEDFKSNFSLTGSLKDYFDSTRQRFLSNNFYNQTI